MLKVVKVEERTETIDTVLKAEETEVETEAT